MRKTQHGQRGITIVEIGVALLVLGLMTGVIVTSKNLIHAARLRSVVQEMEDIMGGMMLFRNKYMEWPGDMMDASTYWADCIDYGGNTCDGDGDEKVENTSEYLRSWQHLALAGMIEGEYTGKFENGDVVRGVNVPTSRLNPAGYWLSHTGNGVYGRQGNHIEFAGENGNDLNQAVLTPEEAWGIDSKVDDGKADAGILYTANGPGVTGCVTNPNQFSSTNPSDYIMENTHISCRLWIWFD